SKKIKGVLSCGESLDFATLSANGKWCAAAKLRATAVHVFDTDTSKVRDLSSKQVTGLAFSPDDRWLGVASAEDCGFWEIDSWRRRISLPRKATGNTHGVLTFSPDSRMAAF